MALPVGGWTQQQQIGRPYNEGQFLHLAFVDGGLECEVKRLKGTPEGQVCHPCPGGQTPLPASRHLDAQHVRVRHLLRGGRVESAVEHLDSLSNPQALHARWWKLRGLGNRYEIAYYS